MEPKHIIKIVNEKLANRLTGEHIAFMVLDGRVYIKSHVRAFRTQTTDFKAIRYRPNQDIEMPKNELLEYRGESDVAISDLFNGDKVNEDGFDKLAYAIHSCINNKLKGNK